MNCIWRPLAATLVVSGRDIGVAAAAVTVRWAAKVSRAAMDGVECRAVSVVDATRLVESIATLSAGTGGAGQITSRSIVPPTITTKIRRSAMRERLSIYFTEPGRSPRPRKDCIG